MIFITNVDPGCWTRMCGLRWSRHRQEGCWWTGCCSGYGVPIDTLEAPEYAAFDPSIKVAYDPEGRRS